MDNYDVAIIGAGPGGYVSAIRSAQLGLKTVVVEKDSVGGTCLNVGCIPTKTLVKNAEIIHEIKHAGKRGLKIGGYEIDMPGTIKMKNKVVAQLTRGVQGLLKANGAEVIKGDAEVISENTVMVEGRKIHFENLIIATGSSNFIPPIPGLDEEEILTSTEILELNQVPGRLAIIGGGVIGCEFATIFRNFGSKVTIIEMLPSLVPSMDKEVSYTLKKSFTSEGINVLTSCKVTEVIKGEEGYSVKISGETEEIVEADKILVSIGRKPNLKGLEKLNLELEGKYIKVNDKLETSIKGVYAIGDVTGKIQLAHVASTQGIIAAENIAGRQSFMSYDVVPNCIYTIPEIGTVGLTESRARELYGEITARKFPMAASGKAMAMGTTTGFTKLVADKKSGKVLGCHIVGPNATEIIGEAAAVMHSEGTVKDISKVIHAHPTINETILEAAHMCMGEPIHITL